MDIAIWWISQIYVNYQLLFIIYIYCVPVQVSLDQYHSEDEIYQLSLQREPRSIKLSVSHPIDITTAQIANQWPPWERNHQLQPLMTQFDGLIFPCCLHNPLSWTCSWETEPLLYNYSVQPMDSSHLSISTGALFSHANWIFHWFLAS